MIKGDGDRILARVELIKHKDRQFVLRDTSRLVDFSVEAGKEPGGGVCIKGRHESRSRWGSRTKRQSGMLGWYRT